MPAWQRRWEGTPMLKVVEDAATRVELAAGLDEIVREGARRMLAAALEAEVEAYLAAHAGERPGAGRRLVVRNGHARARRVTTVAGAVEVRVPRVDDRHDAAATGERRRFRSALLPPWCRRSPKVTEVLPLLYLHGLSSGEFVPALEQFFGSKAGLSASVVTRLTATWQEEQRRFAERDLSGVDYVYLWVDGVHFTVRLDDDRVCTLVMVVGVRADGRKELVALADGHCESTTSWADLLRDCRRRGCARRCSRSATARWGSGRRCARCSRTPASSGTGCTRSSTCWIACRRARSRRPARRWPRSATPRTARMPRPPSTGSLRCSAPVSQGGGESRRRPRAAARL